MWMSKGTFHGAGRKGQLSDVQAFFNAGFKLV